MKIALLVLAAIAVPFTVLAILLLFSRSISWLAPRPRTRASIYAIVGVLNAIIPVWEAQTEGWRTSSFLLILTGIAWIGLAIHEYRRGAIPLE